MDLKKYYIEKAVYPSMSLLRRNHVASYTKELTASEFLDIHQRSSILRQRLSDLLFLCRNQVPAYTDLPFTDLELRREPLDCLLSVDPLPLSDFLTRASQHLCRHADTAHLHRGIYPIDKDQHAELLYSTDQVDRYEAARWRGLGWYGVTYGSPSVLLWDIPREPFFLREEPYMKNRLSLSVCALTDRSVRPLLEQIDQFSPEYISGSAAALLALTEGMDRTGLRLQVKPKVVTITQGVSNSVLRQKIKQIFGCPAAQNLGVRTDGILAYMCPNGKLHITAENCYIEILDPQSLLPVPPGKPGLITTTDLWGQTMPHLRTVMPFMAQWAPEPCPCGRTLPVLCHLSPTVPLD